MSRRLLLLLTAVAAVAAACAGTTAAPVATVGGVPIEEATVLALRHSYADGPTVDGETFREDLSRLVFAEAMVQYAETQLGVTGLDDPERIDAKLADLRDEERQVVEAVLSDPDNTQAQERLAGQLLLIRDEVSSELVRSEEGFLDGLLVDRPETITKVCARHVLVGSLEEADAVAARLRAGEDLAAVAAEVSLDTQSPGGALPCPMPVSPLTPAFAAAVMTAPLGEVLDPVETEFGWHVIVVDERIAPASLEDLRDRPLDYLDPSAVGERFSPWLNDAVDAAEIEIRPDVGTWVPEAAGIRAPPEG